MQSTQKCSVHLCGREPKGRGMCLMHYKRAMTAAKKLPDVFYGAFSESMRVASPPALRPDLGPCWEWAGTVNANGYGVVSKPMFGTRLAHRVSKMLKIGRTLDGDLMHHCDNPPCIRPSHLSEATHQANIADRTIKGRSFAPRAGQAHCKNGHELNEQTTTKYRRPDGYVETRCVECRRTFNKKQSAQRKQERHDRGLRRKAKA